LKKQDIKINTRQSIDSNKMPINQLIGVGIIIVAIYLIIKNTIGFNFIPQVNQNMSLGFLFIIGLLTSLHCIAMCGGINLSQCVSHGTNEPETNKMAKLKPSLMYNTGRVISYTIIGGIVGTLGSVVSFSGAAKGIVAILSGIFMVIMGLNMLNIIPWLKKLNPHMPKIFGRKIQGSKSKHGSFIVGLLNGLMPCGPLQAMQLYALGTGSFLMGAASMFVFSLGTVPLMFGFGALSSLLSGKFTHKMLKVSAILVMVLGVVMVTRGLNLSGINVASAAGISATTSADNVAKVSSNVQNITTKLQSGEYTPITVQKGIPVRWVIQATENDLNGCNQELTIPKFGITKKLVPGDNIIEFTPDKEETIPYTCWMGMISSTIKVVADVNNSSSFSSNVGGSGSSPNSGSSSSGGGCCAAGSQATKFAGGKIPTDNIQLAKIVDGTQEVTITVNNQGYSPAVVVLQKGIKAKIIFKPEALNSCNSYITFPELSKQLNLSSGQTEISVLSPLSDITFQCGMGMLHGYVKVVDDLNKVNLDDIKNAVNNRKPTSGSSGGGCCG
jgi:sulfite exporter TauE/SafE